MYVVKVGEYYVEYFNYWDGVIKLSNQVMVGIDKGTADRLAEKVNGVVVEVTNE